MQKNSDLKEIERGGCLKKSKQEGRETLQKYSLSLKAYRKIKIDLKIFEKKRKKEDRELKIDKTVSLSRYKPEISPLKRK